MSLKRIVNDMDLYESLKEEFQRRLSLVHKSIVSVNNTEDLLRLQGEARALTKLLELKERVNGG